MQSALDALPSVLWERSAIATECREWIQAHLPQHPPALLHGDLLPQNLLHDLEEDYAVA